MKDKIINKVVTQLVELNYGVNTHSRSANIFKQECICGLKEMSVQEIKAMFGKYLN